MIAIDTNIFIYHLAGNSQFGASAKKLLTLVETGREHAVSSVVTYAEILTLPARQKKHELISHYQNLLLNFPNLKFLPVDENMAHTAAMLRGAHAALKLMDAIILATAVLARATALVTEDKSLKVTRSPVAVKTLSEFLSNCSDRPANRAQ